jgi:hypothetical protein
LASGKKSESELDLSSEAAELNRDVLSSLAHELGGIASALDLRAAAMARTIPDQDMTALRDIAEEVRLATRAARFAGGADGSGMLNPMRRQSLEEWWRLTGRFTGVVLPRGVQVEPVFPETQITAAQASALTWLWLAGCKEIAERGIATPATLLLKGGADLAAPGSAAAGNGGVTLLAELDRERVEDTNGIKSRWSSYAARIATEVGVTPPSWTFDADKVRWWLTIPTAVEGASPGRVSGSWV